jgi:hypothetical protein
MIQTLNYESIGIVPYSVLSASCQASSSCREDFVETYHKRDVGVTRDDWSWTHTGLSLDEVHTNPVPNEPATCRACHLQAVQPAVSFWPLDGWSKSLLTACAISALTVGRFGAIR